MNKDFDILIVGAGLSGATVARMFADKGKKVLILEKRKNIAGNVYDEKRKGITVQTFGPHIFHTNNGEVMDFMKPFMQLNNFQNKVNAKVQDNIIPLPFNFKGIDLFWPSEAEGIKRKLIDQYGENNRISINKLLKSNDKELKKVADFIYKNIFVNYTQKMWGVPIDQIDSWVLDRVPVTIGYEERYFSDKYEGVPKEGFTSVVKRMIDHHNIEILLETDFKEISNLNKGSIYLFSKKVTVPVVYTGQIDELFNYRFNKLNYRSLNIVFEEKQKVDYQTSAVVNYPSDPKMTRVSEYKKFYMEMQEKKFTIISKEYPGQYRRGDSKFGIPYYPMATDQDKVAYEKYYDESKHYKYLNLLGRLAEYKYINMDEAIINAIKLAKKLLGD